jgi:hypothetical protein
MVQANKLKMAPKTKLAVNFDFLLKSLSHSMVYAGIYSFSIVIYAFASSVKNKYI